MFVAASTTHAHSQHDLGGGRNHSVQHIVFGQSTVGRFVVPDAQAVVAGGGEGFARDLIESAGVATTPGLDFGTHAPNQHMRFAYTTTLERLAEAVDRIRRFLG